MIDNLTWVVYSKIGREGLRFIVSYDPGSTLCATKCVQNKRYSKCNLTPVRHPEYGGGDIQLETELLYPSYMHAQERRQIIFNKSA